MDFQRHTRTFILLYLLLAPGQALQLGARLPQGSLSVEKPRFSLFA
jgi:hypothetical protein